MGVQWSVFLLLFVFIFNTSGISIAHAFSIEDLPVPGHMVGASAAFSPIALKGLVLDRHNPLDLEFILDPGTGGITGQLSSEDCIRFVEYFLAGLTIPAFDIWVNLSPYEEDRIVPQALGATALGRDMLSQDYLLKQFTASLFYPQKGLGHRFWTKVRQLTKKQESSFSAIQKIWIVPDQAQVFVRGDRVIITKATLKVMLDEDYRAMKNHAAVINSHFVQAVRKVILPRVSKEVNEGKNFAVLRQIYQALILAKWYKQTVNTGPLREEYVNKNRICGIDMIDPTIKQQIYGRYLAAYKKGVFNCILEQGNVPQKYFSGGITQLLNVQLSKAADPPVQSPVWLMHIRLKDAAMSSRQAVNASDHVEVMYDYIRPGVKVAVYTLDPRRRRPHLVIATEAEGKLMPVDRDRGGFLEWNGEQYFAGKVPVRSQLPTIKELKNRFMLANPNKRIVAVTSYENLFLNEPYVAVLYTPAGYKIFHATGKMQGDIEKKRYSMYVLWRDGHASIESNVRFRFTGKDNIVDLFINGKKAQIQWAAFVQLIEKNNQFVNPDPQSFDDVRHLFSLPKIGPEDDPRIPSGLMSGAIFPLADQLREPWRFRQFFSNPLRRQTFVLKAVYIDAVDPDRHVRNSELAIKQYNVPRRIYEKKLKELGYVPEDYEFFSSQKRIKIRLKENLYPFHVVGVDSKGIVKEIAINGKSGERGLTLREVYKLVKELGLVDAGVLDHGTTVRLDVNDQAYGDAWIDREIPDGQDRATGLIFYTADRALTAEQKGGIDFNSIAVLSSVQSKAMDVNNTDVTAKFLGFTPRIISIIPVHNLFWPSQSGE